MKINLYPHRKFLILNVSIALVVLISIIYVNWFCDDVIKVMVNVLAAAAIITTLIMNMIYLVVERDKFTPPDILPDDLVGKIKDLNPDLVARDDSVYDSYSECRDEIENTK